MERGACAVAAALIEYKFDLVIVTRSRRQSGFDYWLRTSQDGQLFQNTTRLEVSGILRGDRKDVRRRADEKIHRLMRYPNRLAALVIVVEFGRPQSHLVWT